MLCDSFFNSSVSFADSSLCKGSLSSNFTNNKSQSIASLYKREGDHEVVEEFLLMLHGEAADGHIHILHLHSGHILYLFLNLGLELAGHHK